MASTPLDPSVLARPTRRFHNPVQLPCTFRGCQRWFRTRSGLNQHIRAMHNPPPQSLLSSPPLPRNPSSPSHDSSPPSRNSSPPLSAPSRTPSMSSLLLDRPEFLNTLYQHEADDFGEGEGGREDMLRDQDDEYTYHTGLYHHDSTGSRTPSNPSPRSSCSPSGPPRDDDVQSVDEHRNPPEGTSITRLYHPLINGESLLL